MRVTNYIALITICHLGFTQPIEANDCLKAFQSVPVPIGNIKTSSESEIKSITGNRVCLKSYPWLEFDKMAEAKRAFMKGGGDESKIFEEYESRFAAFLESQSISALKENVKRVSALLADGEPMNKAETEFVKMLSEERPDRQQIRLWGEHYLARRLLTNNSVDDLTDLLKEIKSREGANFKVVKSEFREVEAATYFSRQQLINYLFAIDCVCKRMAAKENLKKYFPLLKDFLEARAVGADQLNDFLAEMLPSYKEIDQLTTPRESWQRMSFLSEIEQIEGLAATKDGQIRIYLKTNPRAVIAKQRFGAPKLMENGAKILEDYYNVNEKMIRDAGPSTVPILQLHIIPEGYRVIVGEDSITLSASDFELFTQNKLPATNDVISKLSRVASEGFTVFANPFMCKQGLALDEQRRFTFALQRYLPNKFAFRDPLSSDAIERAQRLSKEVYQGPKSLYFVVAGSSFNSTKKPEDFQIIANLKTKLKAAGASVIAVDESVPAWTGGKGKKVFVITGHSDENLAAFVRSLGDKKYFEGNYVIFNSCETTLSEQLVAEITSRYGAISVFQYADKIDPSDVETALLDMVKKRPKDTESLFWRRMRDAAEAGKLKGAWHISLVWIKNKDNV